MELARDEFGSYPKIKRPAHRANLWVFCLDPPIERGNDRYPETRLRHCQSERSNGVRQASRLREGMEFARSQKDVH